MSVSAVLFAKNLDRVASFYRDAIGFDCVQCSADHWQFDCRGFGFTVHRIPTALAQSIVTSQPPQRRADASLRLSFPVIDTAAVRASARLLGGQIDDAPPPWAARSADTFLGCDPEGNVFLIEGPA